MRRSSPILFFLSMSPVAAILALLALVAFPLPARSQQFKILHGFGSGTDGAGLWGSLAFDGKGNLYGTTSGGGEYGHGTVFELTPNTNGSWSETVLHSFNYPDPGGSEPFSSVVLDVAGNLYGTTKYGGTGCGGYGCGTVFELTAASGGAWTEIALYSMGTNNDQGAFPNAGVAIDGGSNLYGAAPDTGEVFEVSPGSGGWTESVLHAFCSGSDGCESYAGVILDHKGNLYGTTESGGIYSRGIVYEMVHSQSGWAERVLHSFPSSGTDGAVPGLGQLAIDSTGNLYGTTASGGANGRGTIFELLRQPPGGWNEKVLYSFQDGVTGWEPGAGVVMDKSGNLYGTTINGGSASCGCGVVYELSPASGGAWTYTVLHTFIGSDGAQPDANLTLDRRGNLYGTTAVGGPYGGGVVFELIP